MHVNLWLYILRIIVRYGFPVCGTYLSVYSENDILLVGLTAGLSHILAVLLSDKIAGKTLTVDEITYSRYIPVIAGVCVCHSYFTDPLIMGVFAGLLSWAIHPLVSGMEKAIDAAAVKLSKLSISSWQVWSVRVGLICLGAFAGVIWAPAYLDIGIVAALSYWIGDGLFKRLANFVRPQYVFLIIRLWILIVGIWAVEQFDFHGPVAIAIATAVLCWMVDYLPEKLKLRNLFRKK